MKACCGLLALLVVSDVSYAQFRATVSAGVTDRRDTPVFVDLEVPGLQDHPQAIASSASGAAPTQVEKLGPNKARVWWIVDRLPAGETRTYNIAMNPTTGPKMPPSFNWQDSSNADTKSMDLLIEGRRVLRYMHTPFDRNDIEKTKKPFHHVFDPDGSRPITKGAGGLYPHHRGIFFGYRKSEFDGKTFDTWHCGGGEHQLHRKVIRETTGPVFGSHELHIDWNDRQDKPFVEETRRLVAFRQSKDRTLIEFTSTLKATRGPVKLHGDRQHAGVQFRAAQEVADSKKATRYLRPAKWADLPPDEEINTPEHKDLPWNAVQYKLGNRAYTIAYLSDPKNPAGAEFSERLYGRFGEYFTWELTKDKPLTVRYRWWITAAGDATREIIEQRYADLADPPKTVLRD